jgi:hypothetical protein
MPDNFVVPPLPPQLIDVLKRQYGSNGPPLPGAGAMPPSPMMQPGLPGGPPATAGAMPLAGRVAPPAPAAVPATPPINMLAKGGVNQAPPGPPGAVPFLPGGGTPGATAPPKVPPVTDDPGVKGGMGPMPQTPDLGSYLNPALQKFQADQAGYNQADEANRIDPQQVKPRLWERLAGFALGATQLKNPENAGNVASEVVNRRRTGAELNRSTALAPWTQRLQQDREGLPLAEAAARTGYEQGELNLHTAAEDRERFTAVTNADYKQAIADVRSELEKDNYEKAENLLDQKQKELELKKTHDKEWYDMQHALLDLHKQVEDRKEAKAKEGKDHTATIVGIEAKKTAGLEKAENTYRRALRDSGLDSAVSDAKHEWTDAEKQRLQTIKDQRQDDIDEVTSGYKQEAAEASARAPEQSTAAAAPAAKPAAAAPVPTKTGPAGEKPTKTATEPNSKSKIGLYKSTGQWMLVPNNQGATQ